MRIRLAIGLALLLVGLGPTTSRAAAPEDATLAIPAFSLSFSLEYLAEDLGLWAKHGLNVKSVMIAGVGSANAVISGSAEAGIASPPTVLRAFAHGQKLLAIAAMQDRLIVEAVLRKDVAEAAKFDPKAPLERRVQVLKGRTMAVESINSIIHAYVRVLAHAGGFDPDAIRIAVMQPPNMVAAFETKQIDGFAMSLPWPLQPVVAGTGVMVASGPNGDPANMVPFDHTMLVVRPDSCEKRPRLCEGMGHAMADAARFMKERPADALALLAKRFDKLDRRLLQTAFDEVRAVTPSPPAPSRAALENADTYNVDAGLMKPEEKLVSYDEIFTDKYVK